MPSAYALDKDVDKDVDKDDIDIDIDIVRSWYCTACFIGSGLGKGGLGKGGL